MKRKSLLTVLFLLVASLQITWAQKVVLYKTNGQMIECEVSELDSIVFVEAEAADTHEWVDLGLPSGTLWATCNVGANSPEEYGDYFAWGETQPKDTYNWSTYMWCNGSEYTMTKYCAQCSYGYNNFKDELRGLLPEDDAATKNWGSPWHTPTIGQIEELCNNCTQVWTQQGGVNGILVIGPNNNTIFLPAAGIRWSGDLHYVGSICIFWSSSLCPGLDNCAYDLYDDSGDSWYLSRGGRSNGSPVRPVRAAPEKHEWVDLDLPSGTLWATCNLGANSPEEYGDYFAWGETEGYDSGKTTFGWNTYKWCNGSEYTLTKYCTDSVYGYNGFTDGLTELLPEDDAATKNWGSDWQMPSITQLQELYNSSYTTTTKTTQFGINGTKITSNSNGNFIFLPAAGYRNSTSLCDAGSQGDYWSRSHWMGVSSSAYTFYFSSGSIFCFGCSFFVGQSIRPVRKQ
ncbi:MAG: hypothetical protein IKP36_08135 [Bacteroidaceae bacterium]|nr:hypothetical protein [Bacteroidaceae bacterium]